jgi:MscS family membrane protein
MTTRNIRSRRNTGQRLWRFALPFVFLLALEAAPAQQEHPLQPLERSTPRAALSSFLQSGDAMGEFLAREYLPSPSRDGYGVIVSRTGVILQGLDLSELPPAARAKSGRAAALYLYEVLSRIPLPLVEEIPDSPGADVTGSKEPQRWVIPNTEIALVRSATGARRGEFLFSADTVDRAEEFFERVRALPYRRTVPLQNLSDVVVTNGGWMVSPGLIAAMPAWLRMPIAGTLAWKWIGLGAGLLVTGLLVWLMHRVSRLGAGHHPLLDALARFALPIAVLLLAPALGYFALVQLNIIGDVGSDIEIGVTAITDLALAWMAWRLAPLAAEGIIAAPNIPTDSVDAHIIRVSARILGIIAGVLCLAVGADRVGVPVYGIVAGLGVGGLAIALAAQPTIENLIGALSLFADKPVRVGDSCQYGEATGVVEAIGLRSTRIRGVDRTLTTIPNATLAKMPIVNFTRRDGILLNTVIGLRYETTPEQLRQLLAELRKLLLDHTRVATETARARFVGFGDSSLNIELFAYVTTKDWLEFLAVREDLMLRVMDLVERSGTAIARPSQTLYLSRDRGPSRHWTQDAELHMQKWHGEESASSAGFPTQQAG